MEYANHGTLSGFLHVDDQAEYNWMAVRRWAREICVGMAYLHGANVIHRDLKTPNVLLTVPSKYFENHDNEELEATSRLECRICDFGLSVQRETARMQGRTRGTFCWMAPEVRFKGWPC